MRKTEAQKFVVESGLFDQVSELSVAHGGVSFGTLSKRDRKRVIELLAKMVEANVPDEKDLLRNLGLPH